MDALRGFAAGKKEAPGAKTDLLLRLFESEWFNEWMCLQYLWQNPTPGVEDYLCNKLFAMPEGAIERFLMEFVYLAVSKPGSALERTIVSLCSKSFPIALKVHWYLLALCQDQQPNKDKSRQLEQLKDKCERAALEGQWDVPFRVTKLDPLSPMGTLSPEASGLMSPILSPLMQAPMGLVMASSPNHPSSHLSTAAHGSNHHPHLANGAPHHAPPYHTTMMIAAPGILTQIDESAEQAYAHLASPPGSAVLLPPPQPPLPATSPPLSQQQQQQQQQPALLPPAPPHEQEMLYSAGSCTPIPPPPGLHITVAQHAGGAQQRPPGGSIAAAAATAAPHPQHPQHHKLGSLAERVEQIRQELGDGEGVTALLHRSVGGAVAVVEDEGLLSDDDVAGGLPAAATPLSPVTRLRHDTYGATRDFVDALCEASSSLASISQEERQRALRHTLDAINRELDKTVRRDIAVWFPMGKRNERVVRISSKEAVLLNSREKAPFLLVIEVLLTDEAAGASPASALASPWGPSPSSSTLLQPNLPALPPKPLHSVHGTLTALSPYLASIVASTPPPPMPPPGSASGNDDDAEHHSHHAPAAAAASGALPPPPPPPSALAVGADGGLSASAPTTAGASPTAAAAAAAAAGGAGGGDSPAAGTAGTTASSSHVPSTATSSGLPCTSSSAPDSVATRSHTPASSSTPTQPLPAAPPPPPPPRAAHAAGKPPGGTAAAPASPAAAQAPPSPDDAAAALTRSMAAPFAAAFEAVSAVFRSGNSRTESGGGAAVAAAPSDAAIVQSRASSASQQAAAAPRAGSGSSASQQAAVVIPHRRRQTSESDTSGAQSVAAAAAAVAHQQPQVFVIKKTQSVSGGGGGGGVVASASDPALQAASLAAPEPAALPPPASAAASPFLHALHQQPAAPAAAAAGVGHRRSNSVGAAVLHEGLPGLSSFTQPPEPPPQQQQLQQQQASQQEQPQAEQSTWATALSSLTRALLPSNPSPPPPPLPPSAPAPPSSSASSATTASTAPAAVLLAAMPALAPPPQPQSHAPLPPKPYQGLLADSMRRLPSAPDVQRSASPLSAQDLDELVQSGALPAPWAMRMATAASLAAPGAHANHAFGSKMAGALASLRGDAPLVRLHIRVLPAAAEFEAAVAAAGARRAAAAAARGASPAPADRHAAALPPLHIPCSAAPREAPFAAAAAAGLLGAPQPSVASSGTGGAAGGGNDSASDAGGAAATPSGGALGGSATGNSGASSATLPSTPSSLLTSGSAKALSLLSKIGLCARPAADGEDEDGGGGLGGAAGASYAGPKMVSVQLEVANGVNLAIISPYRKSRRMPSHEAISMVATQLKISEMPPPLELGPPLQHGGDAATHLAQQHHHHQGLPHGGGSSSGAPSSGTDDHHHHHHAVHASSASFSSLATAAAAAGAAAHGGSAPPPADAAAAGGNGAASAFAPAAAAAAPSLHHGGSSLVFPQPAQVSDPPSPRMLQQQHPQQQHGGRLPMLANSNVVSAAAAAAGGLSPVATAAHGSIPLPVLPPPPTLLGLAAAKPSPDPDAHAGVRQHAEPTLASNLHGGDTDDASSQQQQQQRGGAGDAPPAPRQSGSGSGAGTGSSGSGAGGRPKAGGSLAPIDVALVHSRRDADLASAAAAAAAQGSRAAGKAGGGAAAAGGEGPLAWVQGAPASSAKLDAASEKRRREAWAVYGERWAVRSRRIQRESPHGPRKGWALRCVIVKSGDDCRQEVLALQLIRTFGEIFAEASLPLWVRPYEILVTSNKTAMIEVVPDALSIHTVKHRSPPGSSLSDHFFAKWPKGTPECQVAQRKFTESLAAYSIICYLMQIKDRHNGNVLLDDEGHVVHIDFGFMLSNSPGGVNFESAPFKLTRELLEVMGSNSEGKPSELFDYFKVLMIQGFLACRKHSDRILLLVRMMAKSGLPCFKTGERAVKALEKRLSLNLTEVQAMKEVLGLISDSLDAWRTRQYDYYQRLLNGIL